MDKYYKLAAGTQVREEDFGLLFYQMNGPRLHFVASGNLLTEGFFQGKMTLEAWMDAREGLPEIKPQATKAFAEALHKLTQKGVIVEC